MSYSILQRFQTAKVTFKLTQGHCNHATPYAKYYFLLVFHCTVSEILSLIAQNLKMSRNHDQAHSRDIL